VGRCNTGHQRHEADEHDANIERVNSFRASVLQTQVHKNMLPVISSTSLFWGREILTVTLADFQRQKRVELDFIEKITPCKSP